MAKKQAGRANNSREMNTDDLRNSQDQKSKPSASSSASAGKDDGSVHSPLVAYASILSLLTFCPPFVIFLWYTMVHMDGSVALFWNFCKQEGFYGFLKIWPKPTLLAWKLIGVYAAFEAFLQLVLPGEKVLGPVSPTGHVPEYKANGLAAYFVSLATYIALWWFGVFNPVVVYEHLGEIFSALIIGSFVFCIFLYLKGHIAPSSSDSGSSGNVIIDFYWGMELYPRIGKHFDIKVFTNCRFGMMSWAILVVTYCIKQYEEYGRIADSMLASAVLMLVYITKFFLWESGYWNTMDIAHDRGTQAEVATTRSDIFKKPTIFGLLFACDTFIAFATSGFYICWGCLVWVPSVYTSPALYLVNHPVNLGLQLSIAISILGIICIFINYDCDRQRQLFRKTNGNCSIWGKAPSKIEASYVTTTGEKKSSLLLTSGWWGLARHFHYVPEILAAFFWSVPGLFNHFLPYFYVIFLTILLFDRAQRDDKRCKAKYGKYWDMYCKKVPYKIIPGIY